MFCGLGEVPRNGPGPAENPPSIRLKAEGRRFDPGPGHQVLRSSTDVLVGPATAGDRAYPPNPLQGWTFRSRSGRSLEEPHPTCGPTAPKRLIRASATSLAGLMIQRSRVRMLSSLLKKVALTRPDDRQHRLAVVSFCERL